MELANGEKNKFFTINEKNRYYLKNFNAQETKGQNSVYLLSENVPNNSIVLDVGCGQGRFGEILKKKGCKLYGIDLDEEAIKYANMSGNYDKTFILDITKKDSIEYDSFLNEINEKIDVIILSDIFEHIADPTSLLLECYNILKEYGIILVSVPNIAHVDIVLNLLNDNFNYQDMGILDNTHLKFFTKSSFVDWISQVNETFYNINLECKYLGATFYNNKYLNKIKRDYSELFTILENSTNYNGLEILFKLIKFKEKDELLELNKLKEEEKTDVVKILGEALKGKINIDQKHKIIKGERLWYEQQLNNVKEADLKKNKYIRALEESIEWYKKSKEKIEENDKRKDKYIRALEESIEWHKKNVEKIEENDKRKDNYISVLEESIEWYKKNNQDMLIDIKNKDSNYQIEYDKLKNEVFELRKRIFNIENSYIWKVINLFKKYK